MTRTPILAIRSENAPSNRCCLSQPVDEEPQILSRLESVRSCRVAPLPGQGPRGVLLLVLPVWNPVRPGRESAREIAREGLDPVLNLACAFAAVGDGSCRGASVVVPQFAGRQDVSKVRDPPRFAQKSSSTLRVFARSVCGGQSNFAAGHDECER